jgi:hypothetical protein
MAINDGGCPPILAQKHYAQPSPFTPENLLCEAHRQTRIPRSRIPEICVLPPDGDIVRSLLAPGESRFAKGLGLLWTTDAPFRETQPAIDAMGERNLMAAEMEASARYAFAQVRQKAAMCFAHVINQKGRGDPDFEKGEADSSHDVLQLIAIVADLLRSRLP